MLSFWYLEYFDVTAEQISLLTHLVYIIKPDVTLV